MARYVLSNRRAGKFSTTDKLASRASMASVMSSPMIANADLIQENQPRQETARHVALIDIEPAEVEAARDQLPPDVILEPEIIHFPLMYRPMDFIDRNLDLQADPTLFGQDIELALEVQDTDGVPLYGATVLLFLRGLFNRSVTQELLTDKHGRVKFQFSSVLTPAAVVAVPAGGFWPMVHRGPTNALTIQCPPLPDADDRLGWWHQMLGVERHRKTRGRGVRVGVIDTGVGPHPNLDHAISIGSFIDSVFDPNGGADVDSHGSHVCGTIGAIAASETEFAGLAPGAKLYSARVFPPNAGANQADIANAIDALSREHEVDLINMSLGSNHPIDSEVEKDAIIDALERGTLCICAAGNSNGPVEQPARFAETVAVAAIGLNGWGPPGSIPAGRLPTDHERFGDNNLYHANFSCFGPRITCAGPGVGIISTVPARFSLDAPYASMGGTSMASPAVCGALASILSESTQYKALPRNMARSAKALQLLRQRSMSIGLDFQYQGHGAPQV